MQNLCIHKMCLSIYKKNMHIHVHTNTHTRSCTHIRTHTPSNKTHHSSGARGENTRHKTCIYIHACTFCVSRYALQHTATHCNRQQHTATHCCNTLPQHNATHYISMCIEIHKICSYIYIWMDILYAMHTHCVSRPTKYRHTKHAYTYIYTYIHTHIHTHTQSTQTYNHTHNVDIHKIRIYIQPIADKE